MDRAIDRDKLGDLLERVKAAAGPDRELDAQICIALQPPVILEHWLSSTPRTDLYPALWESCGNGYVQHPNWGYKSQSYKCTASVDAALALVERVLPERVCDTHGARRGALCSAVLTEDSANPRIDVGVGHTRPIAIIVCLITALLAQEQSK